MAVDVDLAEDAAPFVTHEHDELGARAERAGQVVPPCTHIGVVLVRVLFRGGAAHESADRDACVFGRRLDELSELEMPALQYVDADPGASRRERGDVPDGGSKRPGRI